MNAGVLVEGVRHVLMQRTEPEPPAALAADEAGRHSMAPVTLALLAVGKVRLSFLGLPHGCGSYS